MDPQDSELMHKETLRKEDGRYLIYYRFGSSPSGREVEETKEEAL